MVVLIRDEEKRTSLIHQASCVGKVVGKVGVEKIRDTIACVSIDLWPEEVREG